MKACFISVIGRQLAQDKWDVLWEILDAGKEEGAIDYDVLDLDKMKNHQVSNMTLYSDGIIYVATNPVVTDRPYVHITTGTSEDQIIQMVQELANKVCGENDDDIGGSINAADDNASGDMGDDVNPGVHPGEGLGEPAGSDLHGGNSTGNALLALLIEVNGREILLTKEDAMSLKEMLKVMTEYGYKVKDVIVE